MATIPCAHVDVRFNDELVCCLSCGEIVDSSHAPTQIVISLPSTAIETPRTDARYVYNDLQLATRLEIRIVSLLPGSWAKPIQCLITVEDLYEIPEPYEAVSYTWATEDGDDSRTGKVYCDNTVISVTKNCEAVLRRLRQFRGSRRLWVDSICINQSRLRERNHQVGLMDQIYLKASNVCICIEDPAQDYSECIDWLRTGKQTTSPGAIIQIAELFTVCDAFADGA
jgi:hypothetical protein